MKNTGVDITGATTISGKFGCNGVTAPTQAANIADLDGDLMLGGPPDVATADTVNAILAILQSHGLTLIYLLVLRRWIGDHSSDLGPTMAELNERLISADQLISRICGCRKKSNKRFCIRSFKFC